MMPDAMLPAMPSALVSCRGDRRSVAPTPAAAPSAPITAVGWKPARWIAVGATSARRHISSVPTT